MSERKSFENPGLDAAMRRGYEAGKKEARERAEQEAADQAEERRVAREDVTWLKEEAGRRAGLRSDVLGHPLASLLIPPYLFADERSQRRVEEEARQERPLDDYAAWTDQNEQLFR